MDFLHDFQSSRLLIRQFLLQLISPFLIVINCLVAKNVLQSVFPVIGVRFLLDVCLMQKIFVKANLLLILSMQEYFLYYLTTNCFRELDHLHVEAQNFVLAFHPPKVICSFTLVTGARLKFRFVST